MPLAQEIHTFVDPLLWPHFQSFANVFWRHVSHVNPVLVRTQQGDSATFCITVTYFTSISARKLHYFLTSSKIVWFLALFFFAFLTRRAAPSHSSDTWREVPLHYVFLLLFQKVALLFRNCTDLLFFWVLRAFLLSEGSRMLWLRIALLELILCCHFILEQDH